MRKDLAIPPEKTLQKLTHQSRAQPAAESGSSRALLHSVAKLHYVSDLPQNEIAKRLNLSPATVSRLLRRAREQGIVRIDVPDLVGPEDLSQSLMGELGLKRAAVVDASDDGLPTALAEAVGRCLRDARLSPGSVVVVGWGRAVRQVIGAGLPRIPGVVAVPANGGMQETAAHFQINEFVRLAAEQMGGAPRFLHAPYLPSAALRDAFLDDPGIRETVALWQRAEAAVVGVGLPHAANEGTGLLTVTAGERALTRAVGDVLRHYFDVAGRLVPWEGSQRLIVISPEQLQATPLVVGVAVSTAKAGAILGAARSRLINALVTDIPTAQAVLDAAAPAAGGKP